MYLSISSEGTRPLMKTALFGLVALGLVTVVVACGDESDTGGGGAGGGGSSSGSTSSGAAAGPLAPELGTGDGSPGSVTFTEVFVTKTAKADALVDIAFNQDKPDQAWVVAQGTDTIQLGTGVTATEAGTWKSYRDPAAIHFMHKPPAIAWGSKGLWGICGDNDNAQNDPRQANTPNYFMGPALFTSDLTIFTTQNEATTLGSHYDMLHNTSFCRGITHIEENIFMVFNSEYGSLDKYNFNVPHEPGGDDHSDGEIYRFALGQVKGVDGVPSHLAYDPEDKMVYVADTGNARIVKIDPSSGTLGGALPRRNEVLKKSGMMDGTNVEVVVASGLDTPSGIKVKNGLIYVTDAGTSLFHVYDKKTGKEVRKLDTGLPGKSLAGFTFGPEGKVFFVNRTGGQVLRIDVPPRAGAPTTPTAQ